MYYYGDGSGDNGNFQLYPDQPTVPQRTCCAKGEPKADTGQCLTLHRSTRTVAAYGVKPQDAYALQSHKGVSSKDTELATVLLGCDMFMRPVPWNGQTLYLLMTFPCMMHGLAQITSQSDKPRTWPEGEILQLGELYRCQFTNYGQDAIFGLSTEFKIISLRR
jgi:hypothetical protein